MLPAGTRVPTPSGYGPRVPRIVDHEQRRAEFVEAAWQLVAAEGIEALTTRRIAEVTGRSNGALLYYFPNKQSVVTAVLRYAFEATNRRADAADPRRRGLAGLRTLCLEIMPLDDVRTLEARIVVTFWQQALTSAENRRLFTAELATWREEMLQRLREGQADGDVAADLDLVAAVDELQAMLMGLQALRVVDPATTTPERQLAQLDAFLARLRA